MTTTTLNGFVARTTDKALGFIAKQTDSKPLWLPISKVISMVELDVRSVDVHLDGEDVTRKGLPVTLEVDTAFLTRIGF